MENRRQTLGHPRLLIRHLVSLHILAETVAVQTLYLNTLFGLLQFFFLCKWQGVESKVNGVDFNLVFASMGLQDRGQETLRELVDCQPVGSGEGAGQPLAQVHDAVDQVVEPAAEGFETQEGDLAPGGRHLVEHETVEHVVEVVGHQADAPDRVGELQQHFLYAHK